MLRKINRSHSGISCFVSERCCDVGADPAMNVLEFSDHLLAEAEDKPMKEDLGDNVHHPREAELPADFADAADIIENS